MDEMVLKAGVILVQMRDANKDNEHVLEALGFLENLIVALASEASKAQELENKLLVLSWASGVR